VGTDAGGYDLSRGAIIQPLDTQESPGETNSGVK